MKLEEQKIKLESKHVAPYLPYGLKVTDGEETVIITARNVDDLRFAEEFKPILHPLSDLTKEITINAETFIPIETFEIGDDENGIEYDFGNIKLIKNLEYIAKYRNTAYLEIQRIPFGVVSELLKWHFDIFGLIENDLAIDINTIK